jgi:hypothetical protein
MKPLAIDRHGIELLQIGICRYLIPLIALISLEVSEINILHGSETEVFRSVRVRAIDKQDVELGTIRCGEVSQSQQTGSICLFLDGCPATGLMSLSNKSSCEDWRERSLGLRRRRLVHLFIDE